MTKIAQFHNFRSKEFKLMLSDGTYNYLGYILVNLSLKPMTPEDDVKFQVKKMSKVQKQDSNAVSLNRFRKGAHAPDYLVNIILAEGRDLMIPGMHKPGKIPPDPFVKLKIGPTKFKSKACSKTYAPKWQEQYEFHSHCAMDEKIEVDVVDKRRDEIIGRCAVELSKLDKNLTNRHWHKLENGAGEILLLITISLIRTTSHDEQSFETKTSEDIAAVANQYKLQKSFENLTDIGFLVVKVYKANGLASADIGSGKSDPFCVLELVNDRAQTSTVYRSLNPEWNQYFTFPVKDIYSILEINVYDEDQNNASDFLGKVGIPILKIRDGKKRWYALKDKQLHRRAKGQILLEMKLMWNPVRAALRTFTPKEKKYITEMPRFQKKIFVRNLNRVKRYMAPIGEARDYMKSCFTWESPRRSLVAFILFLFITYNWHICMCPLLILLIFIFSWIQKTDIFGIRGDNLPRNTDFDYVDSSDTDNDDFDDEDKQMSLTEKLRGLQDKLLEVQDTLDFIASTIERIRNVFSFNQPFLSFLAIIILSVATTLLFFVPIRYIVMAWGINKFTKRFRKRKGYVANDEILDYLSRVFCDKEIRMYGEFHVSQSTP